MCKKQNGIFRDKCAKDRTEQKDIKQNGGHCGPCLKAPPLECIAGKTKCGKNEYCAIGNGQCQTKVGQLVGKCRPLGDTCTDIFMPVCSCDGKTYPNASCAKAAGKNIATKGECKTKRNPTKDTPGI